MMWRRRRSRRRQKKKKKKKWCDRDYLVITKNNCDINALEDAIVENDDKEASFSTYTLKVTYQHELNLEDDRSNSYLG
jgi:hypothetical protein